MKDLEKIKGDASSRKFFRKKKNFLTSVIVFAKKNKIKNLLEYDAVNKILIKNKILAPKLYKENYYKNYIEIQDFGNYTIYKILKKESNKKIFYYRKIINLLNKIQLIKDKKIKNFKNKDFKILRYNNKILINEAFLFCDWYVKKNLKIRNKKKFTRKLKKIIKRLAFSLKLKNNIFVHRDFHVSNLMKVDKKIGVIDSQDALFGNRAYDLASLIDDVRLKTSIEIKNKIYKIYISKQKKLNKKDFKNDFEILSILRNLKIIGIFTRLALRDGKKKYLKLIPHAWELIEIRINQNKKFLDLKKLFNDNLKKRLK